MPVSLLNSFNVEKYSEGIFKLISLDKNEIILTEPEDILKTIEADIEITEEEKDYELNDELFNFNNYTN